VRVNFLEKNFTGRAGWELARRLVCIRRAITEKGHQLLREKSAPPPLHLTPSTQGKSWLHLYERCRQCVTQLRLGVATFLRSADTSIYHMGVQGGDLRHVETSMQSSLQGNSSGH